MNLLVEQIKSIIDPSLPIYTNLSNASAVINQLGGLNWAGFYLVHHGELVLGPFQGEVACTRIPFGKGVCGTTYEREETIIVDNVHDFPGHIACSSASNSEIVVPIFKDDEVVALIDLDAPTYSRFKKEDKDTLEEIASILSSIF